MNPGLLVCWAPVPPVDGERLWKEMAENLDQLKAFYIHQLSLRCVRMGGGGGRAVVRGPGQQSSEGMGREGEVTGQERSGRDGTGRDGMGEEWTGRRKGGDGKGGDGKGRG